MAFNLSEFLANNSNRNSQRVRTYSEVTNEKGNRITFDAKTLSEREKIIGGWFINSDGFAQIDYDGGRITSNNEELVEYIKAPQKDKGGKEIPVTKYFGDRMYFTVVQKINELTQAFGAKFYNVVIREKREHEVAF